MVSVLGLPVPLPETLLRASGPLRERELEEMSFVVSSSTSALAASLAAAGATVRTPEQSQDDKADGLVFDARKLEGVEGLQELYQFFHPRIRGLARCGRVVVLGRSTQADDTPEQAVVAKAIEGFVRSVSKEIGRKGSTANLVLLDPGAEGFMEPVLRFLLSRRSAFITGQPFRVHATLEAESVQWEQPLKDKVALVTGAARGIGAATARRLAEEGAKVVCLDRPADEELLGEVAQSIGGLALGLDVTDANTPDALVTFLQEKCGGVDVVIHNAGVTRDRTLGKMKQDWWDLALEVNLGAIMRMQDALVSSGCLHEGGRVVCLSSIAGVAGNVGQTNYATSKAALIGYVNHMAPSLAEKKIAIAAIAPGFIETRMTEAIPFVTREGGRRLSNLSQGGLPEDVAELLTFLSTHGAGGLTGELVRICGGSLLGA